MNWTNSSTYKIITLIALCCLCFYIGTLELFPYPHTKTPIGFAIGAVAGVTMFALLFIGNEKPVLSVLFLFALIAFTQGLLKLDPSAVHATLIYKRVELIAGYAAGIVWLYWFKWPIYSKAITKDVQL